MISDGIVNRCPKTKEVYRLWFIFKMPVEVGGGNKDDTDTILKTWLSTPITTAHQALKIIYTGRHTYTQKVYLHTHREGRST